MPIKSQLKHPIDIETRRIIQAEAEVAMEEKLFDVMVSKMFVWHTMFESLDGFTTTSGVTHPAAGSQITITTDGTNGDTQQVRKTVTYQDRITFFSKSSFKTTFSIDSVSNVTAYITVGQVQGGNEGYGFKVVDSTLYGVTHDGSSENAVSLQTISVDTNYDIQAIYDPRGHAVTFLVDRDEVGTSTSNVPSGVTTGAAVVNLDIMQFHLTADEAAAKELVASKFEYWQYNRFKST